MIIKDIDEFAKIHHQKINELGYWNNPREVGTLLMLMITEISKLFDVNKLNKPEKLADLSLRILDYCAYYDISLKDLPEVNSCTLWDMISELSNELEAYRIGGFEYLKGVYIKILFSEIKLYAKQNNIDLYKEIIKKYNMLDNILKRKF